MRTERLHAIPTRRLTAADERLRIHAERLRTLPARELGAAERRLDDVRARLTLLDPQHLLARGWSITRDAAGRVVRSAGDVTAGDTITTDTRDAALHRQQL